MAISCPSAASDNPVRKGPTPFPLGFPFRQRNPRRRNLLPSGWQTGLAKAGHPKVRVVYGGYAAWQSLHDIRSLGKQESADIR